jgi:flagellar motor switch protein FliG
MSKRAASMLREDMDFMGPIGLDQSEKYQKDFLQVIQKLMSTG